MSGQYVIAWVVVSTGDLGDLIVLLDGGNRRANVDSKQCILLQHIPLPSLNLAKIPQGCPRTAFCASWHRRLLAEPARVLV